MIERTALLRVTLTNLGPCDDADVPSAGQASVARFPTENCHASSLCRGIAARTLLQRNGMVGIIGTVFASGRMADE